MPYQASDQETCLFCLGDAEPSQPLKKNPKCPCKYSYHDACYARYDRKEICPLCKRREGEQQQRRQPTAPPASTPSQHVVLTITLPRETTPVLSSNPPAPYIQLPAGPQQQLTHRKLTLGHIICMATIVAATVAILVTIIKVYI